jgi:serine/threonine-protein kinase
MATVYLARDEKHNRNVALKVLKPELAAVVGAERFLAEIETTANLQHPHILPLFDSGEADSFLFYVMPYVEGETLRDRLDREHQLPVDEAVQIAKNVAEALDYAHKQGVIHRDIKPANILLQSGKPVLSDFGIALAVGVAGGGRLTETGLSLGTPHYMSPEQATGDLTVGAATDVYALGCVLYEMMVGEPPYTGSTAQAILGKIVTGDADPVTKHRRSVPTNVDAAIKKALEKVPADRFVGAQDFAKALSDPGFRHGDTVAVGATTGAGPWRALSMGLGAVAVISTVALGWSLTRSVLATDVEVVRFTIPVGEGAEVYLGGLQDARFGRPASTSLAISPDGDVLAYSAWGTAPDGQLESRLYVRRLGQERADAVDGTEGASSPFFSPDGVWIGFFSGPSLRRVPVDGGAPEVIAPETAIPSEGPRGAVWADDGTIIYGGNDGLYRVAASGGAPELLAAGERLSGSGAGSYAQPQMLPGSRTLLFHRFSSIDPAGAEIVSLDLASGSQTTVLTNGTAPYYITAGYLLFMRQGTLMAVAFDLDEVRVDGEPVTVLEDVMHALEMPNPLFMTGAPQLAISPSGHIAYAAGGMYPEGRSVAVRVTGDGEVALLELEPQGYLTFRMSPDGDRLAFTAGPGSAKRIFLLDFANGVTRRASIGGYMNNWPAWSPDGQSIAFSSNHEDPESGILSIYRLASDLSGDPERLASSGESQLMSSWSSEGVIVYMQGGQGDFDIWVLPPGGEPEPFLATDANEEYASFSPDGRWLAHTSNESGRAEVYVRPYPGPGPATQISSTGGSAPAWSPDGSRLYFRSGDRMMMVVDVDAGARFQAGRATPLLDWEPYGGGAVVRAYDVLADGAFIVSRSDDEVGSRQANRVEEFHVVLNFFEELRERVPN